MRRSCSRVDVCVCGYVDTHVRVQVQLSQRGISIANLRGLGDDKRTLLCVFLILMESEVLDAPVDARQGSVRSVICIHSKQ